jgi:hypothetical protein
LQPLYSRVGFVHGLKIRELLAPGQRHQASIQ